MSVNAQSAIVFAPRGRDAAIAASILAEVGIPAKLAQSVEELVGLLSDEAALVIVTEEALLDKDLRGLRHWVGSQAEWSDLPFILLTSRSGGVERNPAIA